MKAPITQRLAEIRAIVASWRNDVTTAADTPYMHGIRDCTEQLEQVFYLIDVESTHPAEGGEGRDPFVFNEELSAKLQGLRADMPKEAKSALVRECIDMLRKHSDALAAPPPQPVAPERGEAKAVAWLTEDDHSIGLVDSSYPDAFPVYRTPQPPPAPTFRDPTIEDAWFVHDTYLTEYSKPFPTCAEAMLTALKAGGFVVNAIGAKVGEKP